MSLRSDKHNSISDDLPSTMIGRFAPSPSGRLHVGNLFSFMMSYIRAHQSGGHCVLRIEDLDPSRSKQQHIDQIFRDLEWFGFQWSGEVVYQSQRTEAYQDAFEQLRNAGLIYPCFCSRADLHAAQAPHLGEEYIYQGTCRNLTEEERRRKSFHRNPSYRIIVTDESMTIKDAIQPQRTCRLTEECGDFIIRRSDGVFAYQLAVVVDDAYQMVSDVCRGVDLFPSSFRQRYVQHLLHFPEVTYAHVPLFIDREGRRLSKRNNDASLEYLIDALKLTPSQIIGYIAFRAHLIDSWESACLDDLVRHCNPNSIKKEESLIWEAPQL